MRSKTSWKFSIATSRQGSLRECTEQSRSSPGWLPPLGHRCACHQWPPAGERRCPAGRWRARPASLHGQRVLSQPDRALAGQRLQGYQVEVGAHVYDVEAVGLLGASHPAGAHRVDLVQHRQDGRGGHKRLEAAGGLVGLPTPTAELGQLSTSEDLPDDAREDVGRLDPHDPQLPSDHPRLDLQVGPQKVADVDDLRFDAGSGALRPAGRGSTAACRPVGSAPPSLSHPVAHPPPRASQIFCYRLLAPPIQGRCVGGSPLGAGLPRRPSRAPRLDNENTASPLH